MRNTHMRPEAIVMRGRIVVLVSIAFFAAFIGFNLVFSHLNAIGVRQFQEHQRGTRSPQVQESTS